MEILLWTFAFALLAHGIIIAKLFIDISALRKYTNQVVVNDEEAFSVAVDALKEEKRKELRELQVKMNSDYRKIALDTFANVAESEGFKPEDRITAASRLIHIVSPVTSSPGNH